MAIRPDEVKQARSDIQEIESIIDDALLSGDYTCFTTPSGDVSLQVTLKAALTNTDLEKLKNTYKLAGWKDVFYKKNYAFNSTSLVVMNITIGLVTDSSYFPNRKGY